MGEPRFSGLGAVAFIVGAVVTLVGNLLHPRTATGALGAATLDEETTLILSNLGIWYPSHALLLFFPVILFVAFLALYRFQRDRGEKPYASLGLVLIALAIPLFLISLVMDGFITPLLAQQYADATGSAKELAGAVFEYNFLLSLSLLGPGFLMYLAGIGFFGGSIVKAKAFHPAVGWAGVAIAVGGIAGYAAGVFGPFWVLAIAFTPLALAFTVWTLAVGIFLWRAR